MILAVAMRVWTDVNIHQPGFLFTYLRVAVFQVATSVARRLDFGTGQSNAAFVGLEYVEIVVSLSICCHHFVCSHKTEACKLWNTGNFHAKRPKIYPMVRPGANEVRRRFDAESVVDLATSSRFTNRFLQYERFGK